MSAPDTSENQPGDNSLLDLARTSPMDPRLPPRLSVQAQAAPIGGGVLCQCANHHRRFGWPNVVNVCLTCSGAAVNEYVIPVRRSGNVGDHLDQVLQARLSVECCCSVEDGGTYCEQPECDIYYCHDCGDEFSEPYPRHEGVDHV